MYFSYTSLMIYITLKNWFQSNYFDHKKEEKQLVTVTLYQGQIIIFKIANFQFTFLFNSGGGGQIPPPGILGDNAHTKLYDN